MAFDTLRSNKMRSALTVLGVVIGVTSIVGMTSLIRGFDSSLRNSINSLGPNTIFVQKFGIASFSSGASFMELMRRPNLTADDMKAIERLSTTVGMVDIWLGGGGPGSQDAIQRDLLPRRAHPADGRSWAPPSGTSTSTSRRCLPARPSPQQEVQRARQVAVVGYGVYEALFEKRGIDPIGKPVRIGGVEYTVIGVVGKRPSPGGFAGADDFAIIPYTAFRKQFGNEKRQRGPFGIPVDDRGPPARKA